MSKGKVLVVDDEAVMRDSLGHWLEQEGYDVMTAGESIAALEEIKNRAWDLAIIDLKMPKMDGLQLMHQLKKIKNAPPVIIMTAYATVDTAVMAMKEGAADYLVKPFSLEEIRIVVNKLVEHQRLIKENILLRQELSKRFYFHNLVGKSPAMTVVFDLIKTVAPTRSTVVIRGESGTGKELVARATHALSSHRKGAFIAAACGAMPETLLETELFGYEKGAFTGANGHYKGRIEMADAGTLFLDEIGDISLRTQVDLLRFLQEREFRRVGGKDPVKVDTRIIAATNRNIEQLIEEGKFREDLYYRLNVITINVPPLRSRKEDIPLLVEHILTKYGVETRKKIEHLSEEVMSILLDHNWPGNVRQLETVIEPALVVTKKSVVGVDDLPADFIGIVRPEASLTGARTMDSVEKAHIQDVLRDCGWNIQSAAKVLGINRVTLYNKIKRYNLKKL